MKDVKKKMLGRIENTGGAGSGHRYDKLAALWATLSVLILPALLSCSRVDSTGVQKKPNILLFSIDTLRADHMGCYGYKRNTTPVIDDLAKRSTLYWETLAPAPWTLPSHAGMLTGVHPYRLGILDRNGALPSGTRVLAEYLKADGYATAGFVDDIPGGWIGAERGFGKGFDSYTHLPDELESEYHYDMAATADAVITWLREKDPDKPFFVFMHTKSVHALPGDHPSRDSRKFPYDKPEPYRTMFLNDQERQLHWTDPRYGEAVKYLRGVNELVAEGKLDGNQLPELRISALKGQYDAGIFYTDKHFGRVLKELDERGIADRTVVIVTSDHGEAFMEHNLLLHKEVYRQLLRVPLIIHLPWENEGRVVNKWASLMDIVPTILDLTGVPFPQSIQGSPLPVEEPAEAEGREYFAYYRDSPDYYYEGYALRDAGWTLVYQRLGRRKEYIAELYQHNLDREEMRQLNDKEGIKSEMLVRLRENMQRTPVEGEKRIEMDKRTLEHLNSLGYIQ
ncbi:sulfatase [Candidatus Moduliflexota bacterium]